MASSISSIASSKLRLLVIATLLAGCAGPQASLSGLAAFGPEAGPVELAGVPFYPQTELQCGPAALATVLGAAGRPASPEELAGEVFIPDLGGSLQLELIASARARDLLPYVVAPTAGALFAELAAGRPVLVLQNLRLASWPAWHYAVVVGADPATDSVVLRSGTERRLLMPAAEFLRTWERGGKWALVLLEPGELPAVPDPARYREAVLGLEESGRPVAAATAWEAALARWPGDEVAMFGAATNRYLAGDLEGARRRYEALLAASPDHAAAMNNLAGVYADLGCFATARALARQALETAGDDSLAARAARDTLTGMPAAGDDAGCPARP